MADGGVEPDSAVTWTVEYSDSASKTLTRLDRRDPQTAKLIRNALLAIAKTGQPRSRGKTLTGNRAGQWRYRIGDWRAITKIHDTALVIETLEVGHRSEIYD